MRRNSGNVGIGTTSPAEALDLGVGNLSIAAPGSGAGLAYINFRENGFNDRFGILTSMSGFGNANTISITANGSGSIPAIADAKLTIQQGGNVGIGTTAPLAKLKVDGGQIAGSFATNSTATIDWNAGNVQTTSAAAGTITFTAGSLIDGGAYTLAFNNATGGSYTFTSTALTFKCNPACPLTVTAGKDTVATFIKAGTTVYVSWVKDFQ
jgi:hypothetical protein